MNKSSRRMIVIIAILASLFLFYKFGVSTGSFIIIVVALGGLSIIGFTIFIYAIIRLLYDWMK